MEFSGIGGRRNAPSSPSDDEMDLRKGPWTVEEDLLLMNYISMHGEGRWDSAARCAGLKRTGKSCRLRWLNYLRPDVRRGNITPQEQLLILDLHSRWGNRWSKIAQHLPGRTDNEIKNYWRTRVQKHARHLRCDVNSKQFKDMVRQLWVPRLIERITAAAAPPCSSAHQGATRELAPQKARSENSNTVGSPPESSSSSSEQQFSSASEAAAAAAAADANSMREFEDMNDSNWIRETMDLGNEDWLWSAQSESWWWQDEEQSTWEESLFGTENLWLQK